MKKRNEVMEIGEKNSVGAVKTALTGHLFDLFAANAFTVMKQAT